MKGMKYVGAESYPTLVQFIIEPHEKNALKKLLQFEENASNIELLYVKRLLAVKWELQLSVNKFEKLLSLYTREHHEVEEIENKCCELLQVPKCVWIAREIVFNDAIQMIKRMIQCIESVVEDESLNEVAFILQVSGCFSFDKNGACLKGIFMMEGKIEMCSSNIIKPPCSIKLCPPILPHYSDIMHFNSIREEHNFFQQLCCSNKIVSSDSSQTREPYFSTIKIFFVPMASCYFKKKEIELSDKAMEYLLKIDKAITEDRTIESIEKECNEFFRAFGYSCFQGTLHFGGIYICKCYTTCANVVVDENIVKIYQKEVIEAQMSMRFPKYNKEICTERLSTNSGSDYPGLKMNTYLQVTLIGGANDTVGFPDWKISLCGSNKTWKMIDCGSTKLPVWEIVLCNHNNIFRNARKLALTLEKCWKEYNCTVKGVQFKIVNYVKTLKRECESVELELKALCNRRAEVEKET